jgi:hypothetical protein
VRFLLPVPDFSDTTTIGILTALGVVVATIAAVTGVVSVLQGRRAWKASARPSLYMTAVRHPKTGAVTLDLINSGGGVALGTTLLLVIGSSVARGRIGNFASGRRLVVETDPMPDLSENPSGGVVSCFEDEGRSVAQAYFLNSNDVRRRYRKRRWRDVPSDEEMFAKEYPTYGSTVWRRSPLTRRCSPSYRGYSAATRRVVGSV